MVASLNSKQPLWIRGLLWLLLLGPFFFLSYGFATWMTSRLDSVGSYYFEWEKHIPLIPWTIVPYWSIDLFYAISVFICSTRVELDSHVKRLFSAQVIAVLCFLAFPLTFSFDRPEVIGVAGVLFETLYSFDKPFNQAPSLHIALLVILWQVYLRHTPKLLHWLCHVIAMLILISVLTTFQHHFIDIPTGLLLGFFCIWMWPYNDPSPIKYFKITKDSKRLRLSLFYAVGAAISIGIALLIEGVALWLFWPACSLLMVSCIYLFIGSHAFQKDKDGKISLSARWILYPYLLAAKINSIIWTRNEKPANLITDQVSIGRFPSTMELQKNKYSTVIDLTAEFSAPEMGDSKWVAIPCLDLVLPPVADLLQAATQIEDSSTQGSVLVCCALGYTRSTLSVLLWLIISNRVSSIEQGVSLIKLARPQVVLKPADLQLIELALCKVKNGKHE